MFNVTIAIYIATVNICYSGTSVQWSLHKAATSLLQSPSSSPKWYDCIHLYLCKGATSLLQPQTFGPYMTFIMKFHCTRQQYRIICEFTRNTCTWCYCEARSGPLELSNACLPEIYQGTMPKLTRPLASMGPGLATPLSDRNIAQFLVSLTLRLLYTPKET